MPIRITPCDPALEAGRVAPWRQSFEPGVGRIDPPPVEAQRPHVHTQVLPAGDGRLALDGPAQVGFIAATRPRWLVTGLGGTLAPRLAARARAAGIDVVAWDRRAVPPEDTAAAARWLQGEARVDAIAHLALGTPAWAGQLAGFAAQRGLPMVFVSTAMVFDHEPDGPHGPADPRTARDDYGRMKCASEDAVLQAHPAATVLRIGWQIDAAGTGNTMLAALDRWQADEGRVRASRAWRPACSFLDDTAAVLLSLLHTPLPGVVHFDSNAQEGHRFDQIVHALQQAFGRTAWNVQVDEGYRHDQRLVGGPLGAPPLSSRLPALGPGPSPPLSAAAHPAAPPPRTA